jgi:hypothetical protein
VKNAGVGQSKAGWGNAEEGVVWHFIHCMAWHG